MGGGGSSMLCLEGSFAWVILVVVHFGVEKV